ncbi:hypothetical protein [Schlesneria sp. T3-172]|uniref:hypothetical protein n=1 Tax=Schlesneria sphaerica TaxID=3373610 RepID=UPI0037C522FE
MAELPNRDQLEAEFARRFGRVARRHMYEFRAWLGHPPDIGNVPQSFWDRMEEESRDHTYAILLMIFGAAAWYHGWRNKESRLAAAGWALLQAQAFATQWTESTRERLENGLMRIRERIAQEEERQSAREARRIARLNDGATEETQIPIARVDDDRVRTPRVPVSPPGTPLPPAELLRQAVDRLLDQTFGAERIEANAIDEVTRGQHAGSEAAVEVVQGLGEHDKWRTQRDTRVCPTCSPNDGVNREDWPSRYAEGPPCHPRCRCWIEYESEQQQP